jgi:hypothetical protein
VVDLLEERREGLLTSIQASDRFGRKPVLVISLLGMTRSYGRWSYLDASLVSLVERLSRFEPC